jgi:hypothetical protein
VYETAQQLLSQLDTARVTLVRQIFGANMEKLNSLEVSADGFTKQASAAGMPKLCA